MRTQEEWNNRVYPKVLSVFSVRLQQDIKQYPLKDVPVFGSYYLYGPTGTGKTLMAAHMYIEARKKQYYERLPGKFLFTNTYDFFMEVKATFDNPTLDEQAFMTEYSNLEFLILDDLGSTRITEWGRSVLQHLINNRYENMLPTVFTSNLSLDDLAVQLNDERTPSRIRRMCKLIKMT